VYFSDTTKTGGKKLPLDYYVLSYNLDKAKQHFKQVPLILGCYENYFGPYPFVHDGYKLVETHYWGMEHQSCISYGNAFLNTPLGFDFIILHETAHEWWGNQLTASDNADMWLHEGFGTYAEALFVECTKEPEEVNKYMKNMRWRIQNNYPVVGPYGVNYQGIKSDNDMYFKGAWIIHTFRTLVNNDKKFFEWLKSLQTHFAFSDCSTNLFIQYTNQFFGEDYTAFFHQYLFNKDIPVLHYSFSKNKITARWQCNNSDFKMPVTFVINNEAHRLVVNTTAQVIYNGTYKKKNVLVDDNNLLIKRAVLKKLSLIKE
jgi:aminopeptidase N